MGKRAIEELGLENASRSARVLLDLGAGGTNPDVVKALRKLKHVMVKQHPRLHAKAYIAECEVVIGSANASANGLGSEGTEATRWHELGCLVKDDRVVRSTKQWFEKMWSVGETISTTDLEKAEEAWLRRQRIRPAVESQTKDILAAATATPREFRNRGIYVVVTTEEMDSEGQRDIDDYKTKNGYEPIAWKDWTEIPKDADLICFGDYEGEGFRRDDPRVCYSPRKINRYKSLVIVTKSSLDHPFKLDGIATWRRALERAKAAIFRDEVSRKKWLDEEGFCMDLGKFAEEYGKESEN